MPDVYILVIRAPSGIRMESATWPLSAAEQLNRAAVMMIEMFEEPWEHVTFCIQDEAARTIRFVSDVSWTLRLLAERASRIGLEVVLGPVLRPDPASEQFAREISHLPWRYLERRADDPGITGEAMQLIQARLEKNQLELTEFVRTWDADRIRNRLLNRHLAAAERRILEEAMNSRS